MSHQNKKMIHRKKSGSETELPDKNKNITREVEKMDAEGGNQGDDPRCNLINPEQGMPDAPDKCQNGDPR